MRDVVLCVLVLLCLALFAAFLDERVERYQLRRELDNATQALIDRDLAPAAGLAAKPQTRRP
jgi:hypothetical protein